MITHETSANVTQPPQRPRLRRIDVPAYLASKHGIDIAVSTLAKMATVGGGPAMQYSGRIPLYHLNDLDEWATARISKPVRSTSEKMSGEAVKRAVRPQSQNSGNIASAIQQR